MTHTDAQARAMSVLTSCSLKLSFDEYERSLGAIAAAILHAAQEQEAQDAALLNFKLQERDALYQRDMGQARQEQREVDAKVAESCFTPSHTFASENAEVYHSFDNGQRHAMKAIAQAIRRAG